MQSLFISEWLKFFFLFTPFFVLSAFLTYTSALGRRERQMMAIRVALAVTVISGVLMAFGGFIFEIFGITLDSFRVGAGILLMLSGISLARDGVRSSAVMDDPRSAVVVPLAMPITIGPATTGTLIVMGADMRDRGFELEGVAGLGAAIVCLGLVLYLGALIEQILGKLGITILSRLTGLVLTALAAQILFAGIHGLMAG
jgi:multiple antibiotic resistance protein